MGDVRVEELETLEDICEGTGEVEWHKDKDGVTLRGMLCVSPEIEELQVHFQQRALPMLRTTRRPKPLASDSDATDAAYVITIEHLPPVQVSFSLSPSYPEDELPTYTICCPYLTPEQLSSVCRRLDDIWEEIGRGEVLMEWVNFIKYECLSHVGIEDRLPIHARKPAIHNTAAAIDPRVKDVALPPLNLTNHVLEHDAREDERCFEQGQHTCAICFSEHDGKDCLRFVVCRHVFCRECLGTHFSTQITDGQFRNLTCPDPDCRNIALPTEVQQLVPTKLFTKYDAKLLETTLAEMEDVVLCPRPACQQPVIVEDDTTLGRCATCSYTFCTMCRRSYHGVNKCKVADFSALLNEYKKGDEEHKAFLIKKYGEKRIRQALEEEATASYLQEETVPCPGCSAHTSKIDGCNKMVCSKCRTYFCYLCRSKLPASDPYAHFNRGPCQSRLFEGVFQPEDEEAWAWQMDQFFFVVA